MEIWEELKKNKESGARRLVDEYGNRLLGAALALCENPQDAEDLVFRTLEQAIKKIQQFNPEYSFLNWLYAILRNFRKMDLRNFRIKMCGIICILAIALGWAIIPSKHIKEMPTNNEAQLISASESKPSQEITGLVILGLLRDCILTRRNNKKKRGEFK